ncbi:9-O-acetyl-N-acetylneuraminate esterase [filamentous cyanobacterium CCP5]|nr:9-O-acetyl-N-acetylneuraminate esterase [filamentous cyanobacterium CCP5]
MAGIPRQRPPQRDSSVVLDFRSAEYQQMVSSLMQRQSLLVLGESGSGKSVLGSAIAQQFSSELKVATATYSGSSKQTLVGIAEALDVPIVEVTPKGRERPLTAEELRVELLDALKNAKALLIVDDAHRFPSSLRYWLEEVLKAGGLMLLLADRPPAKDVFLKVPRLELESLTVDQIRTVMYEEATRQGMAINPSRFAELQQRAGGNPALAKRVIHEELMGLSDSSEAGDHRQYIDGTPFLIAALTIVGIVKFIGIGMGDKALYIVGGVASLLAIALRTVFSQANRGSRARLGR